MPTEQGWLYLAVVMDLFSRRIVGWAMASHMRTDPVCDALAMAVTARRPRTGLIHHSDKGSQYTSLAFGHRCEQVGIRPSTGRSGSCFDNAVTESFFASLETELIDRTTFTTRADAEREVFSYTEATSEVQCVAHRLQAGGSHAALLDPQQELHWGAADLHGTADPGRCGARHVAAFQGSHSQGPVHPARLARRHDHPVRLTHWAIALPVSADPREKPDERRPVPVRAHRVRGTAG
ncbi:integrase-like protein [Haloactinospora alba]|uniref:Integrase-like protein n=1 Tax=Haloactinospora alba TaxID=405555 RepID=A0A543NEI3_9ACTN|nr:integrase-like protein [Haloactinospora alba]